MNWNVPDSELESAILSSEVSWNPSDLKNPAGSRVSNCIVALEKEIATKTSAAETDAVSARVSTASNAIQRLGRKLLQLFPERFLIDFYFESILKSWMSQIEVEGSTSRDRTCNLI